MLVAVAAGPGAGGTLRVLDPGGPPAAEEVADLAAAVAAQEREHRPRWVFSSTLDAYRDLLRRGVRVARCHDLELTEALLLGYEGHHGEPVSVAAIHARIHGRPPPPDPVRSGPAPEDGDQPVLFAEVMAPSPAAGIGAMAEAYRHQQSRIAATRDPSRFRLLAAVESAGALAAAEMSHYGLPWDTDAHDAVLIDLLGPPAPGGGMPRRLLELRERITAAFGGVRVNPESPADVLRAFSRAGIVLESTRAHVLAAVDHPAAPLLIRYKELYRIWTAHGWSWRAQWIRDGRLHPEYVPGGVVSGRWATRGGGALQIPRAIRAAVRADPQWKLVVADASQLEPRVLAAVSGDAGLAAAAAAGDLYQALADDAFGGERALAKVALLGAMYGQTGGSAVPALAALRARFPAAWDYVERAARTGESGGRVRSWLGRTCPSGPADPMPGAVARARGRFTRNFVIQATAAEWALALLAGLRASLLGTPAELVFFQHDEVIVHCPAEQAAQVEQAAQAAADQAGCLLFGDTPVRFPLDVQVVDCYADAR